MDGGLRDGGVEASGVGVVLGWVVIVLVKAVVGGGRRVGGVVDDGVFGGWCAGGIIIFKGVLRILKFLIKFPHLPKFICLMKDLKYEHQSIFQLLGSVQLNFRDRYGKLNIFSKNSSCYQVF